MISSGVVGRKIVVVRGTKVEPVTLIPSDIIGCEIVVVGVIKGEPMTIIHSGIVGREIVVVGGVKVEPVFLIPGGVIAREIVVCGLDELHSKCSVIIRGVLVYCNILRILKDNSSSCPSRGIITRIHLRDI